MVPVPNVDHLAVQSGNAGGFGTRFWCFSGSSRRAAYLRALTLKGEGDSNRDPKA